MPKVSIADTNKIFDVKEGEIVYDALSERGEELPHGCLSGSCGACRIDVLEGQENLQSAGLVENNTIDCLKEEFAQKNGKEFLENKHIRLACRAKIKGDILFRSLK